MNVETPPPLNDAATGMPLINMRPSLARPPFAVKNVMNGSVIAPRDVLSVVIPGMAASSDAVAARDGQRVASVSAVITISRRVDCTSTTGVSPVTVIVSCSAPTRRSALIVITPDPVIATPSRTTRVNPGKRIRDGIGARRQVGDSGTARIRR